jgi:acetyltransferase-like isoleucine patch superfamily enzyme
MGKKFRIGYNSVILKPQHFTIGDFFYSGPYSFFSTNEYNPVIIGDYVMFGPFCAIQGGNHDISFEGYMHQNKKTDHASSIIKIGNGAWIGAKSTIISGGQIGEGSIVGANSLVNNKIPPFVVAGGIPAKILKPRFKKIEQIKNTLQETESQFTLQKILEIHKRYQIKYLE